MIGYLFIAFVAGILVKIVDWIEDEIKSKTKIRYILGITAGLLLAYLIIHAPFNIIYIAVLVGVAITGKVDKKSHVLTFTIAALGILFADFSSFDWITFMLLSVAAAVDEWEHEIKPKIIRDKRIFLWLVAGLFVFSHPEYLIGILAFDIGYLLTNPLVERVRVKGKNK